MAMTDRKRYREWTGTSSTGSRHGLLVEEDAEGYRFTVTGANGKRHASVRLDRTKVEEVHDWINQIEEGT